MCQSMIILWIVLDNVKEHSTVANIAEEGMSKNAIELLLEQFKHFTGEVKYSKREKLIRCMSRQMAIKAGQSLSQKEMHTIIQSLSECDIPNVTASGAPTYIEFKESYLDGLFSR